MRGTHHTANDRTTKGDTMNKLNDTLKKEHDTKMAAIERFHTTPELAPFESNFREMLSVNDHGIDCEWIISASVEDIFAKLS